MSLAIQDRSAHFEHGPHDTCRLRDDSLKPEWARNGLYSVIKSSDAHVRFSFLTGVSKLSKVSLFSELNNLIDITLDPGFSAICGYTEADPDAVFAPKLEGLDRDAIRGWHNGC